MTEETKKNLFETASPEGEADTLRGIDRKKLEFYLAIRKRGIVSAQMDSASVVYEQINPRMKACWVFSPEGGKNSQVPMYRSMGYKLVDWSEMKETDYQIALEPESSGPIRVNDMVLMAGPVELVTLLREMDAKAAEEDWKLPETEYRNSLRTLGARNKAGEEVSPKPVGDITRRDEYASAKPIEYEVADK